VAHKTTAKEQLSSKAARHVVGARLSDQELVILDWLVGYLGTSRANVMRTAVRAFAAQMAAVEKEMKKGGGS